MKLIILRRKVLSALFCAMAAVLMIGVVNHPAFIGAAATTRQLPIYCVQKDYPVCALTFDAAWGNARLRQLGRKALATEYGSWGTRLQLPYYFIGLNTRLT